MSGRCESSSFASIPWSVCGNELDTQLRPWLCLYLNQKTDGTSISVPRTLAFSVQGVPCAVERELRERSILPQYLAASWVYQKNAQASAFYSREDSIWRYWC
jgi:hypothetical protein